MELKGTICTLREWRDEDKPEIVRIANNRKIAGNLIDRFPHPYTAESADEHMEWVRRESDPPRLFAIEHEGKLVGGAGLHPQEDVQRYIMRMGYWLGEEFWGRGIATEAVSLMAPYAFATWPGIVKLEATCIHTNKASARVLEKNGFTHEATLRKNFYKFGTHYDELFYTLLREDA